MKPRKLTTRQLQHVAALIHGPGYWQANRWTSGRVSAAGRLRKALVRKAREVADEIADSPVDRAVDLLQATLPGLTRRDFVEGGLAELADMIGTSAEDGR